MKVQHPDSSSWRQDAAASPSVPICLGRVTCFPEVMGTAALFQTTVTAQSMSCHLCDGLQEQVEQTLCTAATSLLPPAVQHGAKIFQIRACHLTLLTSFGASLCSCDQGAELYLGTLSDSSSLCKICGFDSEDWWAEMS